jgi:hypothetical protein
MLSPLPRQDRWMVPLVSSSDIRGVPSVDVLVAYGADGGDNSRDRFGEEVITADINGDGMDEILVGAYRADGPENSRPGAGEAYIIYGSAGLRGA